MEKSSFYRPQLDVVRFIAFLAVFIHHGIAPAGRFVQLQGLLVAGAGFGLCLFFCLSAYLITLLLLREKDHTGSIHLKNFYLRRILRIWPLYLLALLLGFLYAVHAHLLAESRDFFLLALVMLGNLAAAHGLIVAHLWSISIEEQFYVFWPSIMRGLTRRHIALAALVLIVIANAVLIHFAHIGADTSIQVWCNSFVQFEMFAAGILLAVFDARRPVLSPLASGALAGTAFALWIVALAGFRIRNVPFIAPGPASLCTGYLLVAIACVLLIVAAYGLPTPRPFIYMGKISYGLYVFHIPVLYFLFRYTHGRHPRLNTAAALVITIALAAASYRFFESPFLRLKRRLEIIKTRPV